MNITVTRGNAFVRLHVVDQLTKVGYKVTILDKKKSLWLKKDQKIVVASLHNDLDLKKAIKNSDLAYHFVALSDIEDALNKQRYI